MAMTPRALAPLALAFGLLATGCHQDMWQQPKVKSQSRNEFFVDRMGSRMPVPGTVAYGQPRTDAEFYTGYGKDGKLVREFPVPVTAELIKRGQERYGIFCSHCHGAAGDGQGMIAKRGFTLARPVGNYHSERLRAMPVGHFFDVVTNGYGTMYPFKARIKPYDRWAIAAYIKVLQESQRTPIADLPAEERAKLDAMPYDPSQDAPPEPVAAPPARTVAPAPAAAAGGAQ